MCRQLYAPCDKKRGLELLRRALARERLGGRRVLGGEPPSRNRGFWREAVGPGGSPGGRSTLRPRSPSRRLQLRRRILPARKPGCFGRGWGFGGRGHDSSICH